MKKALFLIAFLGMFCLACIPCAGAQTSPDADLPALYAATDLPPDEFYKAKIVELEEEGERDIMGTTEIYKVYRLEVISGREKGKEITIEVSDLELLSKNRIIEEGDRVVVVKSYQPDLSSKWYIADHYRLGPLMMIAAIFLLAAVVFGRLRGLTSVLGLGVTVAVIILFVVPRIVAGGDPLTVTLMAAAVIVTVSLYLAHGFNSRTSIALVGTLITLAISTWMAVSWVAWARLFGMGSENALFLQGAGIEIDLRGLLLAGILLGVLGILDDITTAQAAIVEELKRANAKFRFADLYKRGLSVGREHIASLINTLFLAYAGASLPLFLLFSINRGQPLWFIVNSETIAEEIVRTLVGSVCLILAVPITTALAASYYSDRKVADHAAHEIVHHHH